MGFSPSEKHITSTSLISSIVDGTTGAFSESLTVSGTPVTGRDVYTRIEDQKSTGTAAGTFTSGAWRTRDLNTVVKDETGGSITLSSNQFTLPAGRYRILAHLPSVQVAEVKGRIQNITDATTLVYGQSNYAGVPTAQTPASRVDLVFAEFTITATKTFEIQHRCSVSGGPFGFGTGGGSFGDNETYTIVEIWTIA